ncbi:hypothetical protein JCM8202v2_000582 [Rhodotorula sphaerocarpa]
MMLKIFYALNSPRLAPSHGPQQQQAAPSHAQSSSGLSPNFLAVLDPALAPSPESAAQTPARPHTTSKPAPSQYTCMARLSTPVWVQTIGTGRREASEAGRTAPQFGRVTLKTCLSAICISRPDLVIDSTKDFSVAAIDPYESLQQQQQAQRSSAHARTSSASGFAPGSDSHSQEQQQQSHEPTDALVEGKGMLSWTLAEKKEGTTLVCGRVVGPSDAGADGQRPSKRRKVDGGADAFTQASEDEESDADEPEETLEVWLQLTEREAFTQGQFLDCLRSYHNPIQHIQSQLAEMYASPPKRREAGALQAPETAALPFQHLSLPTGDPVKRHRPRESAPPRLQESAMPHTAPFATSASTAAASSPPDHAPAAPTTSALPLDLASSAELQDPRTLALLSQILPSLTAQGSGAPFDSNGIDVAQAQALLPAIQTLAKYCGVDLASSVAAKAGETFSPLPAGPGPQAMPPVAAAAPQEATESAPSTSAPREQVGKQNPRDPRVGCWNCKRRKSTTWHEGRNGQGTTVTVCNACGTFYNKNGYHRTKAAAAPSSSGPGPRSSYPGTSPPRSRAKTGLARPLQGRLTATCEADLVKRKSKKGKGSPGVGGASSVFGGAGLVPPLSPSKHIGPRSPSLSFAAAFGHGSQHVSPRRAQAMSSPGRSPRMRYRNVSNPFAATSPVRGARSSEHPTRANIADGAESDGEARGPDPLEFGNLFGMENGSPSPVRTLKPAPGQAAAKGEAELPSYLLTASPGTALDRILNETNIGSISAFDGGASGKRASPTDAAAPASDFSFFLQQPASPTLGKGASPAAGKENTRPEANSSKAAGAASSTDPVHSGTDADSYDSVLSSLRRDFNNRLSSNALTAPSSPAPSSPCVLPRTSTGTPGSKGKAPQSGNRPPPSIIDSFLDGLVPAFALDDRGERGGQEKTPASDSDAWSPLAAQADQDATIRLDNIASNPFAASGDGPNAKSVAQPPRRAAFIPAHLLAPSDATDAFDLGSLPPSSPPMMHSDAFPTPSDFEGMTPSADGGDQPANQQSRQTILEAVAETVAREPDQQTRQAMISLLHSLQSGTAPMQNGPDQQQPGQPAGGDAAKTQLDRETLNRLLGLISAHNPSSPKTSDVDYNQTARQQELTALNAPASLVAAGSQQMHDLYHDLFANPPF